MNKYGPKAKETIEDTLHTFKQGKLRSGKSKLKVSSRQQALAIGINEARNKHQKVPKETD